ncbi:MAG: DUF4302 domain-containing protein [Muribaculum sp.]|nr:DUF4302 domain-containing protein [Muribaculum sp.]
MKKLLYFAAVVALSLTACSSDDNNIFDQSAAERLEQYKKDYADVLTADGGLWSMEYFSNPEEQGYVMTVRFSKDGSVEISANHKWIGGTFQQETSLWKMIADNGPVLSFSSYNKLFHIFADPADITGADQPQGDNGPIDETGFGHEGDYEFQVMDVSEDGKTVRLLGKKRMYNIYLRHLDTNTNEEEYLNSVKATTNFIVPYFGYFNLIAADGEGFIVKNLNTFIPSVYPKDGDEVSQSRSGNVIFTLDGFRFMEPLEVPRADESLDDLVLESFSFQEDGSLLSPNGDKIVGPYDIDAFMFETFDYNWYVDLENLKGKFVNMVANLTDGIREAYPSRSLESVYFGYDIYDGQTWKTLNIKLSGTRAATYYLDITSAQKDNVAFNIAASNSQATTFAKKTKAIDDFANAVADFNFSVSSEHIIDPVVLSLTSNADSNDSITVEIR